MGAPAAPRFTARERARFLDALARGLTVTLAARLGAISRRACYQHHAADCSRAGARRGAATGRT